MFKNKAFAKHAIPVLVFGVLYFFIFAGLQNDHINALQPAMAQLYGWSEIKITNPITIAGFVSIPFVTIVGMCMVRWGATKVLFPSLLALGGSTLLLANSAGNYTIYAIALFLVRLLVVPVQLGSFMLCNSWFIRYRGRAFGFVTIGAPLSSAVLISVLTHGVNSNLSVKGTYTALGCVVFGITILSMFFVRSKPEAVGLYPDGSPTPPGDENAPEQMSLREILSMKASWSVIICNGLAQFIIVAVMAYYVTYNLSIGSSESVFLPVLTIGAALGFPVSYLLGLVDDKLGSIKASMVFFATYILILIPMFLMTPNNKVLLGFASFGVACLSGGGATMQPSLNAYVFGRKKYQAASSWITAIQSFIAAFAVYFMATMSMAGLLRYAYLIMLGMVVIMFLALIPIRKLPDANLADREYGQKQKEHIES